MSTEPIAPRASVSSTTVALFLVSAMGLFLELLLIRWVSTEIRVFAYLQNTVLVVCVLGLGMGCWDSRRKEFALRDVLLPLTALVLLLAVPTTRAALGEISTMFGGFEDLVIWAESDHSGSKKYLAPLYGLILTTGLMILLWEIFVPVGRLLGRLMSEHPNTIAAYSVNVAGSLAGIWLFVGLSAANLPPVVWFAALGAMAVYFAGTGGRSKGWDWALVGVVVAASVLAGWDPGYERTYWSPYQKLSIRPVDPNRPEREDIGVLRVNVNNSNYQEILDLRPETVAARPDLFPPAQRGLSQYDIPCQFHPKPASVLVVGAGSGNDVAGALRNGAGRVVAVEIDPIIIEVGRKHNPEQPYADPRVTVVNDDARSYFATTAEKFDVILFGLLDSHTTTAMTNARLDHYVYTRESLGRARELLAPGGVMVLSFYAGKQFITDRMARTIDDAFGQKSLVFRVDGNHYGRGGVFFVNGDMAAVEGRLAASPALAARVKEWQAYQTFDLTGATSMATDDWPYIYLEKPTIPVLYLLLAAVLGLLFVRGLWTLKATDTISSWGKSHWHFFFMGAAFMLLEVQNVSKAAVVLGNTWVVNAVIISGVLCMILLANLLVAKFPSIPLAPVFALLVGSCVGLYFLDLSRFAFLPYTTKAVVVGLLTSLPMLFSGIVFIRSFAAADRKDAALGANLFGSLVGALLQTATFVIGVKALLLIVGGLYLLAALTRPLSASRGRESGANSVFVTDGEKVENVGKQALRS